MELTWCKVDDGIKHHLKYFCLICYRITNISEKHFQNDFLSSEI